MQLAVVLPIFNEEAHLEACLDSFLGQTRVPDLIVLVDDHSTDQTPQIIQRYQDASDAIKVVRTDSTSKHSPGSKVVKAFYEGMDLVPDSYDLIGKFDGDIVLPKEYFQNLILEFERNPRLGLAGGLLYIKQNNHWTFESISDKQKVRGPIKLYRRGCFKSINGLRKSIGWDTVDQLLAIYHHWEVQTFPELMVKHLRPTGSGYTPDSRFKQGEAFKKLGYDYWLTAIAAAKGAWKRKSLRFYLDTMKGYRQYQGPKLVNEAEATFIRRYRWQGIKQKLFGKK